MSTQKQDLRTAAQANAAGCTRSHPHENMDSSCHAKSAIAEMQSMAVRGAEATAQDLERFVSMLAAAPTTQPACQQEAGPSDPSITLDFKMASELLDMFGGEPGLVTLQHGGEKCHSGAGLYAWHSDLPEEGAAFLGAEPHDEAAPTTQPVPQQEAQHLAQALTDPENQPNQYGVEFGMSGTHMHFKIGNQLFKLAYEPDEQEEFDFMKRMLVNAFTTFAHDVKTAPQPSPAAQGDALSQAARDVLAERQRQIGAEGYDADHDDAHVNDEIAAMAALFVMPPGAREWDASSTDFGDTLAEAILPLDWKMPALGDRRRELVRGAAMVLAELERMDRAAQKGGM